MRFVGKACFVGLLFSSLACGKSASTPKVDGEPSAGAGAAGAPAVEPQPFPPDQVSGTRFRARYWELGGGERLTDNDSIHPVWFDTQLGTPCTWTLEREGYRCRPHISFQLTRLYAEAGCMEASRVARAEWLERMPMIRDTIGPDRSLPVTRDSSCAEVAYGETESGLYELGPLLRPGTLYDLTNSCEPTMLPGNAILRPVVRKLDTAELGTAVVERVDVGHRLGPLQIVAEDGSRQRIGWYDRVLDADCTPRLAADGKLRCLPPSEAWIQSGWFTDAACKNAVAPVVSADARAERPQFVIATQLLEECPLSATRVFRVGAPYSGKVYFGNAGVCTEMPVRDAEPQSYALEEIPPEDMVAFEPRTVGERLQRSVVESEEGAIDTFPFAPFLQASSPSLVTLVDTERAEPCYLFPTQDGQMRCVPDWDDQYSCDGIVARQPPLGGPCAGSAPTLTAAWEGARCQNGYAFSELGKPVSATGTPSCLLPGGHEFFGVGADVAPATFQTVQLVIE